MSHEPDPNQRTLVSTANKAPTTRSSALVKRGLQSLLSLQDRIVRFPADRSMGTLYLRALRDGREKYQEWGEARGNVVVPPGRGLRLKVSAEASKDLTPLAFLKGDDLQELALTDRPNLGENALVPLRGLSALEILDLSCTRISERDLVHLRELTALKWLDLSGTDVSDTGLIHLRGLTALEWLDLSATWVYETGLVHLRELTALERLDLSGAYFTETAVQNLKYALPNCRVVIHR